MQPRKEEIVDEKRLKLIQAIGDEVCEGCGPNRDCETEYEDCPRIAAAMAVLDDYEGRA